MLGAWGILPVAGGLLAWLAWNLTVLALPESARLADRAAAMVIAGMVIVHLSVGWLAQLGWLSASSLMLLMLAAALVVSRLTRHRHTPHFRLRRELVTPALCIALVIGLVTVVARVVPIWQWDSLGYHLPFAQFVVQSGGFGAVPGDIRYISTYPHNIELAMIWLRTMLPDDRLVDLVQVPYGLGGAVVIAAIARRLGARQALALFAGVAWLAAPGVLLQMPTNYVDVGTATALLGALYFCLFAEPTRGHVIIGGVALGLFLGCKPSAPLAAAVLAVAVMVRCRHWPTLVVFSASVLIFGGEMYAVMLLRHGNPVWPVQVHLGPFTLPGEESVDTLLATASAVPRAEGGSLLQRMTLSWLAVGTNPVFDMRLGGFGLLFLFALPVAVLAVVRRRAGWLVAALAISLASPDPSTTRYVLAFAALVFAAAASEVTRWPRFARGLAAALVLGIGAFQVHTALPGFVGDGPALSELLSMSDEARRTAIGPNGRPTEYPPAWAEVGSGESVAFDLDFEFPGLLWSPELRYPVHFLPSQVGEGMTRWLDDRKVRLVAIGPAHAARLEATWQKLFACSSTDCAVYVRREK